MFELTFGRCKDWKSVIFFCLGFFIFEKGRLDAKIQNGKTENFEEASFGDFTKNLPFKSFCLRLFSFTPEKPHVDPKKTLSLEWDDLGPLGLRGISQTLNVTATNPRKPDATFFVRNLKKTLFQNFWSSRFRFVTQKSFFRDEKFCKIARDIFFYVFATARS